MHHIDLPSEITMDDLTDLAHWLDAKTPYDRAAIAALVKLPDAEERIAQHSDPVHRKMLGFALTIYHLNEGTPR